MRSLLDNMHSINEASGNGRSPKELKHSTCYTPPPSSLLQEKEVEESFSQIPCNDLNHPNNLSQGNFNHNNASLKPHVPLTETDAAIIIQRLWRRHIDTRVYHYYRDLIVFHMCGDPATMLRCINPVEASFFDSALGVHVKFRLGGEKFPPNVYYKIFTHRPIQDICANAPRDYTKASAKRASGIDIHNRTERNRETQTEATKAQADWYRRADNNGWRPINDRLSKFSSSDSVAFESAMKTTEFHHSRLKRREEVEKLKKRRKVEWMRKLYQQGALKVKDAAEAEESKGVEDMVRRATAGLVANVRENGLEVVEDWEIDELLHWTTSLNFDEYWKDWKTVATTGVSN